MLEWLLRKRLTSVLLAMFVFAGVAAMILILRNASSTIHLTPLTSDQVDGSDRTVSRISRPASPDAGYVGSELCATCHAKIAETYRRHPMARSLANIHDAVPIEDYQQRNSFDAGPCSYRVELSDGKLLHHEILADTDGRPLYDITTEVQYAMGSGTRGRSYLTQRGDVLTMSSIGWYTNRGWDLSPGYDPQNHQHFNRRVSEACLQCHAGRVNIDRTGIDHFPSPPFLEAAIGCERCHGPGEQHVRYRQSRENPVGLDPIVNPARLSPVPREAVCNQCHLQATERIPRYGRSPQDFRPGQAINDIWTVFIQNSVTDSADSAELVTQVEQMQSSLCFKKSEGRMGCTSCHDPHDSPDPASRLAFYQARCATCHADQGCSLSVQERDEPPASGSCIACHMPTLKSEDVPHTSQSDHRISRRPINRVTKHPARSLTTFQEAGVQVPDRELERARGIMLSQLAEESGNEPLAIESEILLERFLKLAPDDTAALESLGAACLVQSRPQAAEEHWKKILVHSPNHEQALLRLAILAHDAGRMNDARQWLGRFVKVNPTHPMALFRYAHVLGELGEIDQAIPIAKRAIELDPQRLPLYEWLSQAYARQGNDSESRRYLELRNHISRQLIPTP